MSTVITDAQLQAIASTFGTPVYIYHAEKIKEQYQRLQHAFGGFDHKIFYACKALTNVNVLKYVKSIGCNIDCSSINEVHMALKAGFEPQNILYTSSNIHFSEIQTAQEIGVNINIDSLSNLEKFGAAYGHSYPVGIRIRPNIMAGGNLKISTGHTSSKFGVPLEQLEQILTIQQKYNLHIRTLHIHTGSEIKDVEVFVKGIQVLFDLVPSFPELEVIDLGGGFKVPYKPDEVGTDIEALGNQLAAALKQFESSTGKHLQVWFEPGKYMVSECGHFVTAVNVLKQSGEIHFAGVDSGLNHLIRPMFYGSYHKIHNISNPSGALQPYNVVGYICETDTFAEARPLPEVREGDLLVFRNAGAYCFEMSMNYNSRFRPAEVLVENEIPRLIRRREVLEDLWQTQCI